MLAEEGDGDDELGGILKKQRRQSITAEDLGTSGGAKKAEKTQELLDAYFGKDDQLAEDERFLKHYMLKKVGLFSDCLLPLLHGSTVLLLD